jgi:hypothetical protein
VVGDVPTWFTGTKMPLPPQREKFANARQSITAYVNHTTAQAFLLTMDDIYLTEPIEQLPICHLGPVKNYSSYRTGKGTYATAIRQTADWIGNPLAYLAHTPLPLDTAKVRDFLNDYPANYLLEPFLLYAVAGIGGEGQRTGNAKCRGDDNFAHKLALDIPYLSSNPDSWNGKLGDHIKAMFDQPCRWETLPPRS